jgi:phage-related protein
MKQIEPLKPLEWVGSSQNDLRSFPKDIRREAGFALHLAQMGDKSVNAVPMVGFGGASVLEVVMPSDNQTFRAVYTVKFKKAVYVLHAFQKKSKKGIRTPQSDMDLINKRLKAAKLHYQHNYEQVPKPEQKHERAS